MLTSLFRDHSDSWPSLPRGVTHAWGWVLTRRAVTVLKFWKCVGAGSLGWVGRATGLRPFAVDMSAAQRDRQTALSH